MPWKRDGDAGQVPDRPQVRVQIERLAQADVHAREPLADRRRHRALERDLVAADRVDAARPAAAGPCARTRATPASWRLPVDRDAGGGEDADDGVGDFGADAVAGNQRDGVCHSRTYQISSTRPRPMLTVISRLDASRGANGMPRGKREHQHRDAARTTNAVGGGPMNLSTNRPTIVARRTRRRAGGRGGRGRRTARPSCRRARPPAPPAWRTGRRSSRHYNCGLAGSPDR